MKKRINKDRKNRSNKRYIPPAMAIIGLVLIIVAVTRGAGGYPWGQLFGSASQSADDIADPSPITLDKEDLGVQVTYPLPTQAPASEAPVEDAEEPEIENPAATELPSDKTDTENAQQPDSYTVLGVLKIPVLKVSQNLLEGSEKQLKYGVGHVVSTEMPGEKGNCAIAGHRQGPFRYLDMLEVGDAIVIKYNGNIYTYSVYDIFKVLPDEVWVLDDVDAEPYTLTLITCTPYLVYSHRLIVRANLTDINGMTPDVYFDNTDLLS